MTHSIYQWGFFESRESFVNPKPKIRILMVVWVFRWNNDSLFRGYVRRLSLTNIYDKRVLRTCKGQKNGSYRNKETLVAHPNHQSLTEKRNCVHAKRSLIMNTLPCSRSLPKCFYNNCVAINALCIIRWFCIDRAAKRRNIASGVKLAIGAMVCNTTCSIWHIAFTKYNYFEQFSYNTQSSEFFRGSRSGSVQSIP